MKLHEVTPLLEQAKTALTEAGLTLYGNVTAKMNMETVAGITCTLDTRRENGQAAANARIEQARDIIAGLVDGLEIVVNATGHPLGQ